MKLLKPGITFIIIETLEDYNMVCDQIGTDAIIMDDKQYPKLKRLYACDGANSEIVYSKQGRFIINELVFTLPRAVVSVNSCVGKALVEIFKLELM